MVEVKVEVEIGVEVEMEVGTRRGWDSEAVLFCWDELVCRCVRLEAATIGASPVDWLLLLLLIGSSI